MENVEDLFEEADESEIVSQVGEAEKKEGELEAGVVEWTISRSIELLSIDQLVRSDRSHRYAPDDEHLAGLVASIQEARDLIQPIMVRAIGEGLYEIVKGNRRVEALRVLGGAWQENIQCHVVETDQARAAHVAFLATATARPLNPLEIADGVVEYVAFSSAQHGLRVSRAGAIARLQELNRAYEASRGRAGKRAEGETVEAYRGRVLERMPAEVRDAFLVAEEFVFGSCGLRLPTFCRNHLPLLDLPSDVLEWVRLGRIEYSKANIVRHIDDRAERLRLMNANQSHDQLMSALRRWRESREPRKAAPGNVFRRFERAVREADAFSNPSFRLRLKKLLESEGVDHAWLEAEDNVVK